MASFSWKKKASALLLKRKREDFEKDADSDSEKNQSSETYFDWTTLIPQNKVRRLIHSHSSGERLKQEGEMLAEGCKYVNHSSMTVSNTTCINKRPN